MLAGDKNLLNWFSQDQIDIMKEAVEDHRASADDAPRSLYGCIIADADHYVLPENVIRRTIQYGLANYPEMSPQEHIARAKRHIQDKYCVGGYLKFCLNDPRSTAGLAELRRIAADDAVFGEQCARWLRLT